MRKEAKKCAKKSTNVVYFDQRMHACACVCMVENKRKHKTDLHSSSQPLYFGKIDSTESDREPTLYLLGGGPYFGELLQTSVRKNDVY